MDLKFMAPFPFSRGAEIRFPSAHVGRRAFLFLRVATPLRDAVEKMLSRRDFSFSPIADGRGLLSSSPFAASSYYIVPLLPVGRGFFSPLSLEKRIYD